MGGSFLGVEVSVEILNIEYPSLFEIYHRADYMSLMEIRIICLVVYHVKIF